MNKIINKKHLSSADSRLYTVCTGSAFCIKIGYQMFNIPSVPSAHNFFCCVRFPCDILTILSEYF